jgi:RNA polymerase subunit RPABC4/transcription elongation factor Spt4
MISDLTNSLGNSLDAFFSSAAFQTVLIGLVAYLFVLYIATAWWVFRDTVERCEHPVWPYLSCGLILLCSPFFFLAGLVVYRLIRPPERLAEVYERNLAQEALLAEVEEIKTCAGCDRRVEPAWIICPWCRNRLNRVCPNCENLVGLDWTLCAWCGRNFERLRLPVIATPAPPARAAAPGPDPGSPAESPASWRGAGKVQLRATPAAPVSPKSIHHYQEERIVRAASRHARSPQRRIRG